MGWLLICYLIKAPTFGACACCRHETAFHGVVGIGAHEVYEQNARILTPKSCGGTNLPPSKQNDKTHVPASPQPCQGRPDVKTFLFQDEADMGPAAGQTAIRIEMNDLAQANSILPIQRTPGLISLEPKTCISIHFPTDIHRVGVTYRYSQIFTASARHIVSIRKAPQVEDFTSTSENP